MQEITQTIDIPAPQADVFTAFADFPDAAKHLSGVQRIDMLTEGPIGVGTRFSETRIMFGKEATEEMEVTAYDPPRRYTVEARSHGAHYISTFEFVAVDHGRTRVTLTFGAHPETWMARVMGVIMGPLMRKSVLDCVGQDMRDLRDHLASS